MDHGLSTENTPKSTMKMSESDVKMDKSKELNNSMSISPSSQDEYEKTARTLGGTNNG